MSKKENGQVICDFCGAPAESVNQMIASRENHTAICSDCLLLAVEVVFNSVASKNKTHKAGEK